MTNTILTVQRWLGERIALLRDDERGAITTETAVVTFLLVGLAIAVLAIITTYATGVVEGLPNP